MDAVPADRGAAYPDRRGLPGHRRPVAEPLTTAQHYQHRTALLLFLGRPRRLLVLAAQCLCSVLVALVIALASGLPVIRFDDGPQLLSTLAVVPLMAILGVAGATVVRRPLWLPAGFAGWLIFVEGLLYRLEGPLPFSLFLNAAATGDSRAWLTLAAWAGGALLAAGVAITRDMTGD